MLLTKSFVLRLRPLVGVVGSVTARGDVGVLHHTAASQGSQISNGFSDAERRRSSLGDRRGWDSPRTQKRNWSQTSERAKAGKTANRSSGRSQQPAARRCRALANKRRDEQVVISYVSVQCTRLLLLISEVPWLRC
ncbi:hypothetical protein L209DRAFT_291568 [Thermothelomyces heterothallicus CBS 203.75]